jgi:hypothetical protein
MAKSKNVTLQLILGNSPQQQVPPQDPPTSETAYTSWKRHAAIEQPLLERHILYMERPAAKNHSGHY